MHNVAQGQILEFLSKGISKNVVLKMRTIEFSIFVHLYFIFLILFVQKLMS